MRSIGRILVGVTVVIVGATTATNGRTATPMAAATYETTTGAIAGTATTAMAADDSGLERFRGIYKELVETDTTLSVGDCTLAGQRMAARLKAAGYPDEDLRVFVPTGHPKEGGLLAVLHGSDPSAKAILMLAHVDVVEAKREDWTRDPFTLMEEGGYFYGRGVADMKAQAAIWVDNMIRYREEGFKPKRSIKLALTCGEETNSALNGAGWLAKNERAAIDAEFALTEGVDGDLDANGNKIALEVLAAEKTSQNYVFEETNPGEVHNMPAAGGGQRDLSFGAGRRSGEPVRVSGAARRCESRIFHGDGQGGGRTARTERRCWRW